MDTLNYTDLSHSNIFDGLTPSQVEHVLPCITHQIKRYGKGEQLYSKGEIVGNLGLVLDGRLAICSTGSDGRRVTTAVVEQRGLFGEALIFSSGNTLPHDVVALEPSRVLYLAADFFLRPCGTDCPNKSSHGEIVRNMLRILSDRAQALNRKISYLSAPDLRSKIAMYLYDLHAATGLLSFNMPLNRDQLSEYLAVARPSLSRELMHLKKLGIIDFYRSSVKILDLTRLFELAHGLHPSCE